MKNNVINTALCLILAALAWSCEKDPLHPYLKTKDGVYLTSQAYESPYVWGERGPVINFSHTQDEFQWFSIPIRVMGNLADYDREVAVVATPIINVDPDGYSNLSIEGVHWDTIFAVIPANEINGFILIRALKAGTGDPSDELSREVAIRIEIKENEHFDTKFDSYYDATDNETRNTLVREVRIVNVINAPCWWLVSCEGEGAKFAILHLGQYHAKKYAYLRQITGYPPIFWDRGTVLDPETGRWVVYSQDGVEFEGNHLPGYGARLRFALYEDIIAGKKIPRSCTDVSGLKELLEVNDVESYLDGLGLLED